MSQTSETLKVICGETKEGGVQVTCDKEPGHVRAGDEWHNGSVTTEQQITGIGVVHHMTVTEEVSWVDKMVRMQVSLDRVRAERDV